MAHKVGHDDTNSSLLVVKHDRCTTGLAGAKLERPIWVLGIERLTINVLKIIHLHITVIEKDNVSGGLLGNAFANRAMAGVIIYRLVVGMCADVIASASIFM